MLTSSAAQTNPNASPATDDGMAEPGIFKGCSTSQGALPATTKAALLTYLGKPSAASWERLAAREIAGRVTLAEAWAAATPESSRRFPSAAELIRAIRLAAARRQPRGLGKPEFGGLHAAH